MSEENAMSICLMDITKNPAHKDATIVLDYEHMSEKCLSIDIFFGPNNDLHWATQMSLDETKPG